MTNIVNTNSQKLRLANLTVGVRSTLRLAFPQIPEIATDVEVIVTRQDIPFAYQATWDNDLTLWICDVDEGQFRAVGKQKYEVAYKLEGNLFWDGQGWIEIVNATTEGLTPVPSPDPSRYVVVSINGYGAPEADGAVRIPRLFTGATAPEASTDYIEYDMYFDTTTKSMYVYASDGETLSWMETAGGSGGGGVAQVQYSVTHAQLLALKNGGGLIPGCQYRITDYVATTTQDGTESANHPYDIVVTATGNAHIASEAYALPRDGDTYFGAGITRWKIWYSVENDSTRYRWADTVNGKGVVYRMIDQYGNDLPFDFKGITFGGKYTFNRDANPYYDATVDNSLSGGGVSVVVHGSESARYLQYNSFALSCKNIELGVNSYTNTFKSASNIRLGQNCVGNDFSYFCADIKLGDYCSDNTFAYIDVGIRSASMGDSCERNYVYGNNVSFGSSCVDCTVGQSSNAVRFGDDCENIVVTSGAVNISFGQGCRHIDLTYDSPRNLQFDNGVQVISFTGLPSGKALQNAQFKSGLYSKVIEVTYENMLYRDALTTVSPRGSYNLTV